MTTWKIDPNAPRGSRYDSLKTHGLRTDEMGSLSGSFFGHPKANDPIFREIMSGTNKRFEATVGKGFLAEWDRIDMTHGIVRKLIETPKKGRKD